MHLKNIRLVVDDETYGKWRALLDKHNLTWVGLMALGAEHLEHCRVAEKTLAGLAPKTRGPKGKERRR